MKAHVCSIAIIDTNNLNEIKNACKQANQKVLTHLMHLQRNLIPKMKGPCGSLLHMASMFGVILHQQDTFPPLQLLLLLLVPEN